MLTYWRAKRAENAGSVGKSDVDTAETEPRKDIEKTDHWVSPSVIAVQRVVQVSLFRQARHPGAFLLQRHQVQLCIQLLPDPSNDGRTFRSVSVKLCSSAEECSSVASPDFDLTNFTGLTACDLLITNRIWNTTAQLHIDEKMRLSCTISWWTYTCQRFFLFENLKSSRGKE